MNYKKQNAGFTFLELIISVAIFAQLTVMVGAIIMASLQMNQFNKAMKSVNTELYSSLINGIGSYVRRATGIMYDSYSSEVDGVSVELLKTKIHSVSAVNDFDRKCEEGVEFGIGKFDQLTIFQNKQKTKFITFMVDKGVDPETGQETSRLIYQKNNEDPYYLNSEDTYITCFLVSVSPNPYLSGAHENAKDISPYVQISVAARYLYDLPNDKNTTSFFTKNTYISYKTTFSLRNYSY